MVEKAVAAFGKVDILVNNAGMNIRKLAVELSENEWDQVLDCNLKGIFLVARCVGQQMIKQNRGKIINIASIFGMVGYAMLAPYCASKGAILQLTKSLSLEWARHNINVNALAPGYIRTPMTETWLTGERLNKILGATPIERLGSLEDLVGPIIFLASDWSDYITGHTLMVDGGWIAQ